MISFVAEVRAGRSPVVLKRAPFGQVADEWLQTRRHLLAIDELREQTFVSNEIGLRCHLKPYFGER